MDFYEAIPDFHLSWGMFPKEILEFPEIIVSILKEVLVVK